jgi:hypothetical protein
LWCHAKYLPSSTGKTHLLGTESFLIVGGRHLFIGMVPLHPTVLGCEVANVASAVGNDTIHSYDGDVNFAQIFSSPSKIKNDAKNHDIVVANRAATQKAPNVDYKRLIEAGTGLASEVAGHSNKEQNVIYSLLTNHAQDYDSGKYVGSALEPIAAQLASLCQGMETSKQVGGMKKKLEIEWVV